MPSPTQDFNELINRLVKRSDAKVAALRALAMLPEHDRVDLLKDLIAIGAAESPAEPVEPLGERMPPAGVTRSHGTFVRPPNAYPFAQLPTRQKTRAKNSAKRPAAKTKAPKAKPSATKPRAKRAAVAGDAPLIWKKIWDELNAHPKAPIEQLAKAAYGDSSGTSMKRTRSQLDMMRNEKRAHRVARNTWEALPLQQQS